jgi:hypothetical protein
MKSLCNRIERLVAAFPRRPSVDEMMIALTTHSNLATDAEVKTMVEAFCSEDDFARAGIPTGDLQLAPPQPREQPLNEAEIAIIGSLYDRLIHRVTTNHRRA